MAYKLASLFDGSGGFPLAASLSGITPVWAAEVEPYPVAVTRSRFPNMLHLGDVSKINGAEVEPVDVLSFGSPCQDLSIAGKRAGIKHSANGDEETTRSGLFMEAVRIIKEMRKATNGKYPRYALWENVPGAYSSNSGEDFRIVLEELIKVVEPAAVMPAVPSGGWPYADHYSGEGWSLAYRTFDAKSWGVPQRRRRIHLIADFSGQSAGEVLFEREGVRGYFAEGRAPWQDLASDAQDGTGAADRTADTEGGAGGRLLADVAFPPQLLKIRGGCKGGGKDPLVQIDKSATLTAQNDQTLFQPMTTRAVAYSFDSLASNSMKSPNPLSGCREVNVARTLDTTDPNPSKNQGGIAIVETGIIDNIGGQSEYGYQSDVNGTLRANAQGAVFIGLNGEDKIAPTLIASMNTPVGTTQDNLVVCHPAPVVFDGANVTSPINASNPQPGDPCHTLSTDSRNLLVETAPVYCLQGGGETSQNSQGSGVKPNASFTLNTTDKHGVAYALDVGFFNAQEGVSPTLLARQYKDPHLVTFEGDLFYIVRRLMPVECARLQGFPDWWGEIDDKETLTDEEYRFWLAVRNTHAAINDKKVQDYTREQMLTWYKKLHTDSAEYKMWGNGIALPPALYVMQGIVDALRRAEEDAWLS